MILYWFSQQRITNCGPGSLLRAITIVIGCLLVLTACGSSPVREYDNGEDLSSISDPRARQMLRLGQADKASDRYSSLAARTKSTLEQQDYLLVAAEILYDRGKLERGAQKKAAIPTDLLTLEFTHRLQILDAKDSLFNNDPRSALATLPITTEIQSPLHKARAFEVQAQSFNLLELPDQELAARINLEQQLSNATIIDKNHLQIWQLLTTQPQSTLNSMTTSVQNNTYQGWIALALANASGSLNPSQQQQNLEQWMQQFPGHPATERFLAQLNSGENLGDFNLTSTSVNQIAVLLPMSVEGIDAFAGAIRDGIVAAFQNSQDQLTVPRVKFYDTGSNVAFVRNVFQAAIDEGADAVIGPLRKNAVAAIATLRNVPIPVITLNYIDSAQMASHITNIIQFGLAPEDEARSAASRALASGFRNAIVLQSDDSRGDRESRAFQEEMLLNGGEVLHTAVLPVDSYDYSQQIRDALLITQSDQRFRRLSNAIGTKLFFEPSIRDDLDLVFLAISSEQAQSVRPQLSFFRAHDIPKFGTSRIATIENDLRTRKDLNGIAFADAPWILDKSIRKDKLYQQINASYPDNMDVFAKLYALGIDAYNVTTNLQAFSDPNARFKGYTGELALGLDGKIRRHLMWAQYKDGNVVPLKSLVLASPTFGKPPNN